MRATMCVSQSNATLSESLPHISCRWGKNEKAMVRDMQRTIQDCIAVAGGTAASLADLVHLPLVEPIVRGAAAVQDDAPPPATTSTKWEEPQWDMTKTPVWWTAGIASGAVRMFWWWMEPAGPARMAKPNADNDGDHTSGLPAGRQAWERLNRSSR